MAQNPAPSLLVLNLLPQADPAVVERALSAYLDGESGPALTRIEPNRYVLSRSVYKRLRVQGGLGSAVQTLAGIPGVATVDPVDAPKVIEWMEHGLAKEPIQPGQAAPADEISWNLKAVRAPAAWSLFGQGERPWQRIRIAQLDTGYTPIDCFGPWSSIGLSASMKAELGQNYFDENERRPIDPLDESGTPGHGTRIGSVITGYDRGRFSGVAPGVQIVPYRVTNFVVIDTLWNRNHLHCALDDAMGAAECEVVNISLGDPCRPPRATGAAIDRAYMRGVIVCAAAGNVTSEVTYPGRHARAITAGGSTPDDKPWSGGSRGDRVTVSAPAHNVRRARVFKNGSNGYSSDYSEVEGDGTSYATAHLSAAAALWIAFHGRNLDQYGRTWRRIEAFRAALTASARVPQGWPDHGFGAGVLDIEALLKLPLPNPETLRFQEDIAADDLY